MPGCAVVLPLRSTGCRLAGLMRPFLPLPPSPRRLSGVSSIIARSPAAHRSARRTQGSGHPAVHRQSRRWLRRDLAAAVLQGSTALPQRRSGDVPLTNGGHAPREPILYNVSLGTIRGDLALSAPPHGQSPSPHAHRPAPAGCARTCSRRKSTALQKWTQAHKGDDVEKARSMARVCGGISQSCEERETNKRRNRQPTSVGVWVAVIRQDALPLLDEPLDSRLVGLHGQSGSSAGEESKTASVFCRTRSAWPGHPFDEAHGYNSDQFRQFAAELDIESAG